MPLYINDVRLRGEAKGHHLRRHFRHRIRDRTVQDVPVDEVLESGDDEARGANPVGLGHHTCSRS